MTDQVSVYQCAPSLPMREAPATAFLLVWLDTALHAPAGLVSWCPVCRRDLAAVTVGRGEPPWFRCEPCGCLCEIRAER